MHRFLSLLSLSLLLSLGVQDLAAAKKDKGPADAPPQLISVQGGVKWKNTKELKAHAAKGDPQACFELGTRMLEGDDEVASDLAQARVWLEKAAAGGVADAHFRLGKIYHDARGVPRDYAKALECYTTAARLGVPEAQHNIGAMLVSARGVKRNYVEGLAWLLLAEESGAASQAPQQVRERLARKPADIEAAQARAKELSADLPNAIVRLENAPHLAPSTPALAPPATEAVRPVIRAPASSPKIDPITPPKLTVPTEPPGTGRP
jgi:hypothetical protein